MAFFFFFFFYTFFFCCTTSLRVFEDSYGPRAAFEAAGGREPGAGGVPLTPPARTSVSPGGAKPRHRPQLLSGPNGLGTQRGAGGWKKEKQNKIKKINKTRRKKRKIKGRKVSFGLLLSSTNVAFIVAFAYSHSTVLNVLTSVQS